MRQYLSPEDLMHFHIPGKTSNDNHRITVNHALWVLNLITLVTCPIIEKKSRKCNKCGFSFPAGQPMLEECGGRIEKDIYSWFLYSREFLFRLPLLKIRMTVSWHQMRGEISSSFPLWHTAQILLLRTIKWERWGRCP